MAGTTSFGNPYGISNPPFDPRRYSTNPAYGSLQQGYMVQHQGTDSWSITSGQTYGGLPWKFRFMYNPSQIAVSYNSADVNRFPSNFLGNDQASSTTYGNVSPTCSFSLYLDRTYEINQPAGGVYSHKTGVAIDVDYFEKVAGIDGIGTGPILAIPIDIYFGGPHALHWLGIITSAAVTYAQFTDDMAPMNAELDLSFQQIFPGSQPSTGTTTPAVALTGQKDSVGNPLNNEGGVGTKPYGPPVPKAVTPPNSIDGPAPHPSVHLGYSPPQQVIASPIAIPAAPGQSRGRPIPTPFK